MAKDESDGGLSKEDLKKIQNDIKTLKELIKFLEKLGLDPPKFLLNKLSALEKALNAAEDVGEAMEDASEALAAYRSELIKACQETEGYDEAVCEAKVARKWQAHGTKFTFDVKEKSSVFSKTVQKTVARYAPEQICKRWDYCAEEMKKK